MSYGWGLAAMPAATFDGQVQVDHLRAVWQWSSASGAWLRRSEFEFNELNAAVIFATGIPITQNPLNRYQSLFGLHWDVAFNKCFVVVEKLDNPTVVYGRIAHVSLAQLMTWLPTVVPVSGGNYSANFCLRVLHVVDATVRPHRVYGWSGIYGAMRGRKAYRRLQGRWNLGLPDSAGIDPKFYGWVGGAPRIATNLVQYFLGATPATNDDDAVWFPRGKQDLYRMPKNGGAKVKPTEVGRQCWNSVLSAWQAITPGTTWLTADGTSGTNPALIWLSSNIVGLHIGDISAAMKGCRFTKNAIEGVVAYHLTCATDANLHAFYVKPLGLTKMAVGWNLDGAIWELIALARYRGDAANARYKSVTFENRQLTNGWRWRLHNAVPASARRSGAEMWSPDTDRIPTVLHFYARHRTTGVSSPLFPGCVEIVRRRNNMTMAFQECRG